MQRRIGVIGGSGLYAMPQLVVQDEIEVETPFGAPSDAYLLGELEGRPVAFLARHGRGHRYNPGEVPYRANVYGFKVLGAHHLLSVSAVGSLREAMRPGDMVVIDQFIDRTRGRASTFFDRGAVAHVAFADPVCGVLSKALCDACDEAGVPAREGGTYVCIEGPQFSTRAESHLYRSWNADVIGMTNATEAKLAREAEIAYAVLAMVCDYDCWHDTHEDVTAEMVIAILNQNVANAQQIVRAAVARLDPEAPSSCAGALRNAILTRPDAISDRARQRLALFLDPILGESA